ncbi:uncharacterized protein [Chelonus insularis]|uniref:uncharacterized protein n=1 Tax=Chelonus insularis TaxID=460826 RepID=UPI00158DA1A3|nr:uncharacterized protein LOC118065566 [Chelonus insularis]
MSFKREQLILIKCSAVISLMSAIIVTTSLSSDYWITGNATAKNGSVEGKSLINYGLFKGFLQKRFFESPWEYNIYLTCIWDRNVCIWSCQNNEGLRKKEVIQLLNNEETSPCTILRSIRSSSTTPLNETIDNSTKQFLNSGMFLTSIIFVVLTMISLYMSSILALVNCYISPVITMLNINGIMISSGLAFVFNFIGLIIFGYNYHNWIKENIGIVDTIVGYYESSADLGYSYWIYLFTCILSPIPIVLLHARNMILMQSRAETTIVVAKTNDPTTALY